VSLAPVRELALRECATQRLVPEQVAGSGIDLSMAVVRLESRLVRYVEQNGRFVNTCEGPVDAARASAAIPGVFAPVTLGPEGLLATAAVARWVEP
jgi:hypothetical protein